MMLSSLQSLMDQRQLWRARESGDAGAHALASGWPRLDRELYGAGWPMASLSELLCIEPVLAWQLLQPALVRLSQQQRLLVWIGHQQPPYAPAWRGAGLQLPRCLLVRAGEDEAPWAAEQALRLAQGGAVILQADKLNPDRLRRLQLAAQAGNSFGFLLRPLAAQRHTSPAVLRLMVQAADSGLQVQIVKRRGGTATTAFVVPVRSTAPVKGAGLLASTGLMQSTELMPPTSLAISTATAKSPLPMKPAVMPAMPVPVVASVMSATPALLAMASSPELPRSRPALAVVATELSAAAVQAVVENESAPFAQQRDQRSSVNLPPRMAASFLTKPLLGNSALAPVESASVVAGRCVDPELADAFPTNPNLINTSLMNPILKRQDPAAHESPAKPAPSRQLAVQKQTSTNSSSRKPDNHKSDNHKSDNRKRALQSAISTQLDLIPSKLTQANLTQANPSPESIRAATPADKTRAVPDGHAGTVERAR